MSTDDYARAMLRLYVAQIRGMQAESYWEYVQECHFPEAELNTERLKVNRARRALTDALNEAEALANGEEARG